MRARSLILVASFASVIAAGAVSAAEPAAPGGSRSSIQVGTFRLQSNFWVNLHQRLVHAARFKSAAPEGLTAAESAIWSAAVDGYEELLGRRSPIFDAELISINASLSAAKTPQLPDGIPEPVAAALGKARPVYEKDQWVKDDRANRFWMALAEPMLASAGSELIEAHEKAYGIPFPKRIVVDVASHAWQFGAYTVGDRLSAHSVVSSRDPGYQGISALESLMHEASHAIVGTRQGAIGGDLARAATELDVEPRGNLWHAILFYTSGELTRRALAERGVSDYVPYVYRGMFERGFRGFQQPLEAHWRAYLDGEIPREEAIRRILADTTATEP
ncbi:MAG TPA: hypothetical protein VMS56_12410 [Thermoanaerobaculia bacterium]|nr:hypothetical protein [Thermoanaerobaculia bacterium]